MRDNQRQKVYDSEKTVSAYNDNKFDTIHELTAFVDKITKSAWYRKRFHRWQSIKVHDGRGRRKACGSSVSGYIKMPTWSRTKLITLHELSHVVQPEQSAWHGREFCKIYLAFVKKWISKEVALELKNAFKKHRAKYTTSAVKV